MTDDNGSVGGLVGGEVIDVLLSEGSVAAVLEHVVRLAVAVIPQIAAASISMLRDGGLEERFETVNASSEVIRVVDETQYEHHDGPCVRAIRTGTETHEVLDGERWPRFTEQARALGILAVWSLPMTVRQRTSGALNLYASGTDPWDGASAEMARALVHHAAIVVANTADFEAATLVNQHLTRALESRDLIGQAKGILMGAQGISADAAFDVLRRASQRQNQKLVDVAAAVVWRVTQLPSPGVPDDAPERSW